jgi:DNA-directed RNA polymerase subunit alpha
VVEFPIITSQEELIPVPEQLPVVSIKVLETEGPYGRFAVEPLERGFGITLGNPIRRVLLGGIPGATVTWVRINGVLHEYATVPHMRDDVMGLIQRVKMIRLKPLTEWPGRMHLDVTGPGEVFAGDITTPADFEIVNPELHIASLDSPKAKLVVEFNVEHGKGYIPAHTESGLPIGTLPVDAIFTPVRKVNYTVERTRVGQVTDYERLVLEVWTDGSLTPVDAVQRAAQVLMDQFFLFTVLDKARTGPGGMPSIALSIPSEVYNFVVEDLGLSSRTLNCLKRSEIHKIGDLLERRRDDLLKIRNFGERSLNELIAQLEERGFPIPGGSVSNDGSADNPSPSEISDTEA